MDLLISIMSSGTVFTRKQLVAYHGYSDEAVKAGEVACPEIRQTHITRDPIEGPIRDQHMNAADRIIFPVRDPVRSLLTGYIKGNPQSAMVQRMHGWRGIIGAWRDDILAAPIDIHEPLRAEYWRKIVGDMHIDWSEVANSYMPQGDGVVNSWRREQDAQRRLYLPKVTAYVEKGIVPEFAPTVQNEWEVTRDAIQKFLEGLGYQQLPWWR